MHVGHLGFLKCIVFWDNIHIDIISEFFWYVLNLIWVHVAACNPNPTICVYIFYAFYQLNNSSIRFLVSENSSVVFLCPLFPWIRQFTEILTRRRPSWIFEIYGLLGRNSAWHNI